MSAPVPGPSKPVTRVELKRLAIAEFIRGDEELRGCELFRGLPSTVFEQLVASAVGRRFADTGQVFQAGDKGQSLFLVLAGEARLTSVRNGNSVEVAIARKGECFGEEALATEGAERGVSVTARGALDVAEFSGPSLADAFRAAPSMKAHLAALHAKRQAAQDEMSDFLNRW